MIIQSAQSRGAASGIQFLDRAGSADQDLFETLNRCCMEDTACRERLPLLDGWLERLSRGLEEGLYYPMPIPRCTQ